MKYINNLPTKGKYQCEICGRWINKKNTIRSYLLCSKHMHQLLKYDKFLDTNPRTIKDLNNYKIDGEITYGEVYDGKTSEKISDFIIDTEDLSKIRYHKWRLSHSHVVTGLPANKTQRELSWTVLDINTKDPKYKNMVIDHINGNPLDNRKNNLRVCKQSENILNKKFMSNNSSGFIGVSYKKDRNSYDPEIRLNSIRCHLGATKTLEEAVYKRYVAEKILFKNFANEQEHKLKYDFTKNLPEKLKRKLEKVVEEKLKNKNLWQ